MTFPSVLFLKDQVAEYSQDVNQPETFVDLNLDQVIDAITLPKKEYNLCPFFFQPLQDIREIAYRQEVFRDIENDYVYRFLNTFEEKIARAKQFRKLSEGLYTRLHQQGWYLESAAVYCEAVRELSERFSEVDVNSAGLKKFRSYLAEYSASISFCDLEKKVQDLKKELGQIKYCIHIKESRVKVKKFENEIDYSTEVLTTFEKFKQKDANSYRVKLLDYSSMSHVEAQILDCVAKLYPALFKRLEVFYQENMDFIDAGIQTFSREIQFYLSYIDFISDMKGRGLNFCYPSVSKDKKISFHQSFDIALADLLVRQNKKIVCNDFKMNPNERIFVVSGPNQGGKTTFARMFAQMHYLASLGVPVPGMQANLKLVDRIFTHFEKEEDIRNLRGKLKDDLVRIHEILDSASSDSLIILNEIFTSTALNDAVFLSSSILSKISELDCFCVFVSFIDELSRLNKKTVSLVSTIVPGDPTQRTFKIVRKQADGLSYAISIAEKYKLTQNQIKERIQK